MIVASFSATIALLNSWIRENLLIRYRLYGWPNCGGYYVMGRSLQGWQLVLCVGGGGSSSRRVDVVIRCRRRNDPIDPID